jgi:O-antigen/teichoic acid export membrane protein
MSDVMPEEFTVTPSAAEAMQRRRAEIGGDGLRGRVATGTIVNTLYLLSVNGLTIVQGLLMARLLGAGQYGLWGLLAVSFGTLFALAALGFDDKYIQQDHPDQRAAFEIAFTLQSMLCGLFTVLALIAIPLFSMLYDEPRILAPGLILALAMPLIALQTPVWVFYRRMDFVKQRLLQSCQPVVTFVVTVTLAVAGEGFWSLVIGTLAGSVTTTTMAVMFSPYKLRFRYERGAFREYATFSWPLMVRSASGVVMFQVPITLAARTLGAAAVGAIGLASQITLYTRRVDDIVTTALYPAICAVKDRTDLLFESFSKSNRLAVLWGFPAGVAATLFAAQAVPLVLGDQWQLAVPLVQVLGLSTAVDQIGFNWTAFARARGETRMLAVASVVTLVVVISVSVPMLLAYGLPGFAIGIGAGTLANLAVRMVYLVKLFPAARMTTHVARSVAPTIPAVAAVLAGRALVAGDSVARMLVEAALYLLIVAAGTWLSERALLVEAIGYIGQRVRSRDAHADPATRLA